MDLHLKPRQYFVVLKSGDRRWKRCRGDQVELDGRPITIETAPEEMRVHTAVGSTYFIRPIMRFEPLWFWEWIHLRPYLGFERYQVPKGG